MIGIINYKAGNAPSVLNSYNKLGIEARLIENEKEILSSDKLVLPGVGSAKATMDSLRELNIIDALKYSIFEKKKMFLGICIGMQILFEYSEEGNAECLGFLKGDVKKFDAKKLRVPQIGWNKTEFLKDSAFNKNIEKEEYFYFVNSYYVNPTDKDIILGQTDYGGNFPSVINWENIFATQFHAEKSGEAGLCLLKNFNEI